MEYLIIFLLVAGGGIALLWAHQRRQRTRLDSVDGFRESLLRISSHTLPTDSTPERETPPRPAGAPRRLAPLDPARREAARRRLEARRVIRSH